MLFGGGAFERYLGHVGGGFMDEISVRIKEIPDSSRTLLPCEDTEKRQPSMNHKAGPHQTLNLATH